MKLKDGRRAGYLVAALLASGCSDIDPVRNQNEQGEQDTGWGIAYLTGHLLNTYIANRPPGQQDVTVACTQGGTVRMVGTTVYDNATALMTMDLTYEFSNAHASVVATNLTVTFHPLTGSIRQTGVARVGSGESYENHTSTSTGLAFNVTIERPSASAATLAENGPYHLSVRNTTNAFDEPIRSMDGQLDGHDFSWEYPLWGSNGWTDASATYVYGLGDVDAGDGGRNTQSAGWGLVYLTGFLFNNHIATRAAGAQNVTVACSGGGTINMNGTTRYNTSTAILSMDIVYSFADANASLTVTNMVVRFHHLTGSMRQTGALRVGSGESYENHTTTSASLAFDGTVEQPGIVPAAVTGDGPYDAVVRNTTNALHEVYLSVDGQLDGYGFSWDYRISDSNTNSGAIRVDL